MKSEKRMEKKTTHKTPQRAKPFQVVRPTHSEDGVDLTLIRWMLSLTPAERLKVLQDTVRSLLELREKFKESARG